MLDDKDLGLPLFLKPHFRNQYQGLLLLVFFNFLMIPYFLFHFLKTISMSFVRNQVKIYSYNYKLKRN